MSATTLLFLAVRVTHVLLAALWLGATGFVSFFLIPAIQEMGPGGLPVVGALSRRKMDTFMASIGGMTVLTGIYLYWRFTGGFEPAASATRGAMVFGTGGIAGIVALIIGGAVLGRNAKKMGELGGRMASTPEGPQRAAIAAEMAATQQKAATAGRLVVVLQMIALALMAVGHYV
jgi:uncharacterized membrane protein